jgi:hypothetical protein
MDDESKPPPLVFANQVIGMLADNILGDSVKMNRRAYLTVRVVFRKLGGSWFEVCQGSPEHINLLIESVKAWGARKSSSN